MVCDYSGILFKLSKYLRKYVSIRLIRFNYISKQKNLIEYIFHLLFPDVLV